MDGSFLLQLHIGVADVLQLGEEPLVYLGEVVNLLYGVAEMKGFLHHEHTLVGGGFKGCIHIINFQFVIADKAVQTLSNHAETFLDGLFEGASNCHHFAHRLHGRTQFTVNTTELAEVPTGYLAHHIVEGWLEEGRGGLGDRVFQVEESVAETEFGCNKGERIARGFRCQSGGTRKTGIHLNHTVILAFGVESILHVALADDADVADDLDSEGTEFMVFAVGECL